MTKNGLKIQTIPIKRTDLQTDRVLLLGQMAEKEEKADPSQFLKFLLASHTNGTFGFAQHTSRPFAKPKEPLFAHALKRVSSILKLSLQTEKQVIIKGQIL